jgi:hypothetical protein
MLSLLTCFRTGKGMDLRNLRCAILFCTLRRSVGSVMDAQSSSGDPADAYVSLDWHVLELRCDILLLQC